MLLALIYSFAVQVPGDLSRHAIGNNAEDGSSRDRLHLDLCGVHHITVDLLLSTHRHVDAATEALRLCSGLAFAEHGKVFLSRTFSVLLRRSPATDHRLLRPHLLPRLESKRSWNCEHLAGHLSVEDEGPKDDDRCRHTVRVLLAAPLRGQPAPLLRNSSRRRRRLDRISPDHKRPGPGGAVAWVVEQLHQSDHLLSLQS